MSEPRAFFEGNGYLLAKGVYSAAEMRDLEEDFDRIVRQVEAGGNAHALAKGNVYTLNPHQYSSRWMRALLQERFLGAAEELIGPDIVLSHSSLVEKRKSESRATIEMHQDWSYMPTRENTLVSGMIHVSSATEEMGCLRVFPGSHKHGRIPESSRADPNFHERFPIETATPVEAEPGDVTFFSYFVFHGSMPNRTEMPRKTVITRVLSGQDEREGKIEYNENIVLQGFNYHTNFESATKGVVKRKDRSK
jgi:phytanoyl-CoA hydroxylase